MDIYEIEDLILAELRRMASLIVIDDADVGLVHFSGTINIGRLAKVLHEEINVRSPGQSQAVYY